MEGSGGERLGMNESMRDGKFERSIAGAVDTGEMYDIRDTDPACAMDHRNSIREADRESVPPNA